MRERRKVPCVWRDRDIEALLDEGRRFITPRPPVERINGATVDVRWHKFLEPSVAIRRRLST